MPSNSSTEIENVLRRGVAEVLPARGSLAKLMSERKIRVYLGIDPTGALLTLGHSVVLRKLQQFAELGHEVILLIGNGTVRIGDPTGRDSTRPMLSDEEIEANFKNWQEQASKVLDFTKITIKRNGDWLDQLTYAEIVKLMAQTTVQQLIERDMFQDRLKNNLPIYGHEIMYPLLQGYDSVAMDVDLEIGGTDQTFNMMMGRHLQKSFNNREKWVLTTPIINGTDGRKMSKSFGNFVALTENPTDMYGKLMSVPDDQIIEYFTLLTDVAEPEIIQMSQAIAAGENPMQFKKRLAFTITQMYHSANEATSAQEFFERTVQSKEVPSQMPEVSVSPVTRLLEVLKACQPQESTSQLRRVTEQGGVELNGERVTDPLREFTFKTGDVVKIGKRNFYTLKV
jgi:tyrosyl-tRNA synthetase